MRAFGVVQLSITLLSLLGIAIGAIWLFFRPAKYKRELEIASRSDKKDLRRPKDFDGGGRNIAVWGMSALAGLTVAVLFLTVASKKVAPPPSMKSSISSISVNSVSAFIPQTFSSLYVLPQFKRPLPRQWKRNSDGTWGEYYDGKLSNTFDSEGIVDNEGCSGLLLTKRGEPSGQVLITSSGCVQMMKYRWNNGPWKDLGPIENPTGVQTAIDPQ